MITTILWDVDGTLLDFRAAERAAIKALFSEYGLGECTDAMVSRYSEINDSFWQRLERNEITKKEALMGRFEQFFGEYGIDVRIVPEFNSRYQLKLGDTIVYRDDSLNIVKSLKGKVKQYAVSNGTVAAQTKKLERSRFGELMDGVFLSEKLGVEKPNAAFFEKVFEEIRPEDLQQVMIVGDSLTSDIQGGMNAGIRTCWYDPERKPVPGKYRVDYVIGDLHELAGCLEAEARPGTQKMKERSGMRQIFESDRISFVEVSELLIDDYLTMVNDIENVRRFIGGQRELYTAEQEISWVREKLEEKAAVFSMLEKESGSFIGNIELMDLTETEGELGIAITADKQDRGYGTEAILALTDYGMVQLGLQRITLRTRPFNARAIHVYEKCGFREYGVTEDHICMEITR